MSIDESNIKISKIERQLATPSRFYDVVWRQQTVTICSETILTFLLRSIAC